MEAGCPESADVRSRLPRARNPDSDPGFVGRGLTEAESEPGPAIVAAATAPAPAAITGAIVARIVIPRRRVSAHAKATDPDRVIRPRVIARSVRRCGVPGRRHV